jgi:hypothetical protein
MAAEVHRDYYAEVHRDYYAEVHRILHRHVRRGNAFAVCALLSLRCLYEDPRFWATCRDHAGIAASVMAMAIESAGDTQALEERPPEGGLSPSELYILLRRCGEDGSLVSGAMRALESGKEHSIDLHALCAAQQAASGGSRGSSLRPLEKESRQKRPRDGECDVSNAVVDTEHAAVTCIEDIPGLIPGSIRDINSIEDLGEGQPLPDRPVPRPKSSEIRSRRAFTAEEDAAIIDGVRTYGVANFKVIFEAYRDKWGRGRTVTHLKDHWRAVLRKHPQTFAVSSATEAAVTRPGDDPAHDDRPRSGGLPGRISPPASAFVSEMILSASSRR